MLAKRHHNTKRTYLLVNPLQAKHIPVSPSKALEMMNCLGEQIAKKYSSAKLVIGFAETATAIGATVAGCLDDDCKYIHTTREQYSNLKDWIYFSEEHSHAVEQKLFSKDLEQWISNTQQIIFVDDEISTGKTLINIVEQLRKAFPSTKKKQVVAASIINRLSPENEERFKRVGIVSEFLVKLNNDDFTSAVAKFDITPAKTLEVSDKVDSEGIIFLKEELLNPRFGVDISKYNNNCSIIAKRILNKISNKITPATNVLVLGTEECMYPSLIFGHELEKHNLVFSVKCHATTRSPIGICAEPTYPIISGYKIHSFYDNERETYIYNLTHYDMAIVITDVSIKASQAQADISMILKNNGCREILFVEGGNRV